MMFIPLYTYCQLLVDNLAAHCEINVKKSVFTGKTLMLSYIQLIHLFTIISTLPCEFQRKINCYQQDVDNFIHILLITYI